MKYKIIELENEIVIVKGLGSKEEALKSLNRWERKNGMELTSDEELDWLKPIYELTITERYDIDKLYSWKTKPFIEDKKKYKTPIGYVIYY
jgi:hypothetical protein